MGLLPFGRPTLKPLCLIVQFPHDQTPHPCRDSYTAILAVVYYRVGHVVRQWHTHSGGESRGRSFRRSVFHSPPD